MLGVPKHRYSPLNMPLRLDREKSFLRFGQVAVQKKRESVLQSQRAVIRRLLALVPRISHELQLPRRPALLGSLHDRNHLL